MGQVLPGGESSPGRGAGSSCAHSALALHTHGLPGAGARQGTSQEPRLPLWSWRAGGRDSQRVNPMVTSPGGERRQRRGVMAGGRQGGAAVCGMTAEAPPVAVAFEQRPRSREPAAVGCPAAWPGSRSSGGPGCEPGVCGPVGRLAWVGVRGPVWEGCWGGCVRALGAPRESEQGGDGAGSHPAVRGPSW